MLRSTTSLFPTTSPDYARFVSALDNLMFRDAKDADTFAAELVAAAQAHAMGNCPRSGCSGCAALKALDVTGQTGAWDVGFGRISFTYQVWRIVVDASDPFETVFSLQSSRSI